jgi:hypothetical protein
VSTIEELLERKSSGSCLERRKYGHADLLHRPCDTLYPQKLALTSLIKATEFIFGFCITGLGLEANNSLLRKYGVLHIALKLQVLWVY